RDCSAKASPTHLEARSALACASASFSRAATTCGGGGPLAIGRRGTTAGSGCRLPFLATAGAIGALPTAPDPHCGQVTSPRALWPAKSPDEPNQASKRWPLSQERSK